MRLRNKTKSPKELRIKGKVVVVKPKEIIEAEKVVYDSRSFEKVEKKSVISRHKKSSTRLPGKLIKKEKIN